MMCFVLFAWSLLRWRWSVTGWIFPICLCNISLYYLEDHLCMYPYFSLWSLISSCPRFIRYFINLTFSQMHLWQFHCNHDTSSRQITLRVWSGDRVLYGGTAKPINARLVQCQLMHALSDELRCLGGRRFLSETLSGNQSMHVCLWPFFKVNKSTKNT